MAICIILGSLLLSTLFLGKIHLSTYAENHAWVPKLMWTKKLIKEIWYGGTVLPMDECADCTRIDH